jgi:hypothetical protein
MGRKSSQCRPSELQNHHGRSPEKWAGTTRMKIVAEISFASAANILNLHEKLS